MHFKIDPLSKYPGLIPVLARWHHREWKHLNHESYDLETRIEDYRQAVTNTSSLPQMLVAHLNGHALGSARLIESDMDTHPELGPWLASLFVPPDFRRQGIASRLIPEIESVARQLGHSKIYLFTEDMEDLYKKQEWQPECCEEYYGETVTIMSKIL